MAKKKPKERIVRFTEEELRGTLESEHARGYKEGLNVGIAWGQSVQKAVDDPAAPRRTFADVELAVDLVDMDPASDEANLNLSQWLGEPRWLQSEEVPAGGPWRFLMQIDSSSDAYVVNFGDAGVAYVFVAADGSTARFLWQCC